MSTKSARSLFAKAKNRAESRQDEFMSLEKYFENCQNDPLTYAGPWGRLRAAIGDPVELDTATDERLQRIFAGKKRVMVWPTFSDFFGSEETVEKIVKHVENADMGLEECRQVFYLLGPVGGGKSSYAERIKELMEVHPIHALEFLKKDANGKEIGWERSPINEIPLGLFNARDLEEYGIPERRVPSSMSPWALKRMGEIEASGDDMMERFRVAKIYPDKLKQIAIAKVAPADENNQDVSDLVGKVDIRKLEFFSQSDTDAYDYSSGGLCRANQGVLEMVEIFKAPLKSLNPLLTVTQERTFEGTQKIGMIPADVIVLGHSNDAEWQKFKNNKTNEAFVSRTSLRRIPYVLRATDEAKIYRKMLKKTELAHADLAPRTLDILAKVAVMTRLSDKEVSNLYTKMMVYDGEDLSNQDLKSAKDLVEYKDKAGVEEGMTGDISTRFSFKVLSNTFNDAANEGVRAADPVLLFKNLIEAIDEEGFADDRKKVILNYIKAELQPRYVKWLGDEIQRAYVGNYNSFGQNLFDKYVAYADAWMQNKTAKNPNTGTVLDREKLNVELVKYERPAGIPNAKEFRNEIVMFALRNKEDGKNPSWTDYEPIKTVIEKMMFQDLEKLLPIISAGEKQDDEQQEEHDKFIKGMKARGYSQPQVERVCEWYMSVRPA